MISYVCQFVCHSILVHMCQGNTVVILRFYIVYILTLQGYSAVG